MSKDNRPGSKETPEGQRRLANELALDVATFYAPFVKVNPSDAEWGSVQTPLNRFLTYISQINLRVPDRIADMVPIQADYAGGRLDEDKNILLEWFDRYAKDFYLIPRHSQADATDLAKLQKRMGMLVYCLAYGPRELRRVITTHKQGVLNQDPLQLLRETFIETSEAAGFRSTFHINVMGEASWRKGVNFLVMRLLDPDLNERFKGSRHFEGVDLEPFGIVDPGMQSIFMTAVVANSVLFTPGSIQVDPEFGLKGSGF